jgi:hypothetical protein
MSSQPATSNPFTMSQPAESPFKVQRAETKPAVVAQPSFGDELLNAVKNPKLRKRKPKEAKAVAENSFEESLKNAKLKPAKQAEPEPVPEPEPEPEDFSDLPPLVENIPEFDLLGRRDPPKPQEVFESPETENILVIRQPERRTGVMTMTEMTEGRRIVPNVPLPFLGPGRSLVESSDDVIVPKRPSREELGRIHERRIIQEQNKPTLQITEKPSINETEYVPLNRKEAYDEDETGQAESYKAPEIMTVETEREQYLQSIKKLKNYDLKILMENEGLRHQWTTKDENGKPTNKKLNKEEMRNALAKRHEEKIANEKRLFAKPKTRSRNKE